MLNFFTATQVQHTGPKLASQQNSSILYLEEITKYLTEGIWLSYKIIYVVVCHGVSLGNVFLSNWTVDPENVCESLHKGTSLMCLSLRDRKEWSITACAESSLLYNLQVV